MAHSPASSQHSNPARSSSSAHSPARRLAIIGSGPAALTAALYAARAGITTSVYERNAFGGALTEIAQISNFPGFSGSGPDLAASMRSQAEQAGAQFRYGECTSIAHSGQGFDLTIDGESVSADAVLVATGSEPRPLPVKTTKPVSYCALCDGDLVKGQNIAVIGGANSALQEALYLANLAKNVTIISHSPLKADACLRERLASVTNIAIQENTEATPELLDSFDHIFVFIGKTPASHCLDNLAETLLKPSDLLDQNGYIITLDHAKVNEATSDNDFSHQTVVPGLFAAGDVRATSVHQAITAAGDGAAAAIEIANYLKKLA